MLCLQHKSVQAPEEQLSIGSNLYQAMLHWRKKALAPSADTQDTQQKG